MIFTLEIGRNYLQYLILFCVRGDFHEIKSAPVDQKLETKVPSFEERKVLR